MRSRTDQRGFTLIELLIAMAVFALIGVAGFAFIDGIVRIQTRTDQRLDQLAGLQRAMYILTLDLEQTVGDLALGAGTVSFRRAGRSELTEAISVRYEVTDRNLSRTLTQGSTPGISQVLISNVTAVQWRLLDDRGGWLDNWPAGDVETRTSPRAVALDLTLAADETRLGGHIRRIVDLPRGHLP